MPTPSFLSHTRKNLDYWSTQVHSLNDKKITALREDRQNIFLAIEFGLMFPETLLTAVHLILRISELIEYHYEWRNWLPLLESALRLVQNQPDLYCRLLNQSGFAYLFSQRLHDSILSFRLAQITASENNLLYEKAYAIFGLSHAHYESRQYAAARDYGQTAFVLFEKLPTPPRRLAAVQNMLGMIALRTGEYLTAEQHFIRTVALRQELDRPTELVQALNNLGLTYQVQQKYESALEAYSQALSHAEHAADLLTRINTRNSLGTLYFELGHLAEADATFRSMDTSYLRRAGHLILLAQQANNVGNVLFKRGQTSEAESWLRQAETLWRQTNDPVNLANTLGTLAETLIKRDDLKNASELLLEATTLLIPFQDDAWAMTLLKQLQALHNQYKLSGRTVDTERPDNLSYPPPH